MVVEKNNKFEDYNFKKGNLNFAVVGHVEWINFLKVDQLPKPGVISHSENSIEYPAGGGSAPFFLFLRERRIIELEKIN